MRNDTVFYLDRSDLSGFIRQPARDIHKGNRGGVLVVGGSWNYRGAPLLAALGALRAGAGLVVLAVPDFLAEAASIFLPEAIFLPLKTSNDEICPDYLPDTIAPWIARCGSAVFGPGIGRGEGVYALTHYFWTRWSKPLLLDADALYFFAQMQEECAPRKNCVITPHSGEAGTILKCTADKVNEDRLLSARMLAAHAGVAVLKGQDSIVAADGVCRIIKEGSPALAIPGSGDVLSGAIGAFLATGMEPFNAASAGTLLHATAGAKLEEKFGVNGLLAREIANEFPSLLRG